MSGVWGWFGGQSAQKKKDTPKNAILGLRSQLEMLQKRERHLQNQMDEQDTIARKNVSTNKNGMSRWALRAFFPLGRYEKVLIYMVVPS
jgi:charged multivesicular body protein 4